MRLLAPRSRPAAGLISRANSVARPLPAAARAAAHSRATSGVWPGISSGEARPRTPRAGLLRQCATLVSYKSGTETQSTLSVLMVGPGLDLLGPACATSTPGSPVRRHPYLRDREMACLWGGLRYTVKLSAWLRQKGGACPSPLPFRLARSFTGDLTVSGRSGWMRSLRHTA